MTLPYLFFYLLALSFASFNIFSPTGEMNRLDLVFYWLDKVAFLAFPPLLLHFFMIFPLRKRFLKDKTATLALVYAPAALLFLARIRLHIPLPGPWSDAAALKYQDALERLELVHFTFFALLTVGILAHSTLRAPSILVKKQLRLIVYGLAIGVHQVWSDAAGDAFAGALAGQVGGVQVAAKGFGLESGREHLAYGGAGVARSGPFL